MRPTGMFLVVAGLVVAVATAVPFLFVLNISQALCWLCPPAGPVTLSMDDAPDGVGGSLLLGSLAGLGTLTTGLALLGVGALTRYRRRGTCPRINRH